MGKNVLRCVLLIATGSGVLAGCESPGQTGQRPWWDWMEVTSPQPDNVSDKPIDMNNRPHQRPWWDWAGVTEPEPASVNNPTADQRPWWDWMGVTTADDAGQPASTDETPWWDWMGVTQTDSRLSDGRPWWDWAGVTDPDPGKSPFGPTTTFGENGQANGSRSAPPSAFTKSSVPVRPHDYGRKPTPKEVEDSRSWFDELFGKEEKKPTSGVTGVRKYHSDPMTGKTSPAD